MPERKRLIMTEPKQTTSNLIWTLIRGTVSTSTTTESASENAVPRAAEVSSTIFTDIVASTAEETGGFLEPLLDLCPNSGRIKEALTPFGKTCDEWQKEIRATVFFLVDIAQVTTKSQFICRVLSFIDTLCPKVTVELMRQTLKIEFGEDDLTQQAGEEWMDQVRYVISNWKVASTSALYESLRKLVGMISWALISAQLPSEIGEKRCRKLYEVSGVEKINAVDFPLQVLESSVAVYDAVKRAIDSGRLLDIFGVDEGSLAAVELEHARLMSQVAAFVSGTIGDIEPKTTREAYLKAFAGHVDKLTAKLKTSKGAVHDRYVKMHFQASAKYADVQAYNLANLQRMMAYCLVLHGETGVAKSSLVTLVSSTLMRYHGYRTPDGKTDPLLIGTHNPAEAFHSGLHAYDVVQVIDDLGNTKPEYSGGQDPTAILLDVVNTAPRLMNKADVEQKGKVPFKAPFAIVTTNDKTLSAATFSVHAGSRLRRPKVYIEVTVRERYADGKMLDSSKVPDGEEDLWLFNVTRFKPDPANPRAISEPGQWVPVKHTFSDGVEKAMTSVGVADLLAFLCDDSAVHFAREEKLVAGSKDYHERQSCPHNMLGGALCRLCTPRVLESQAGEEIMPAAAYPICLDAFVHPPAVVEPPHPKGTALRKWVESAGDYATWGRKKTEEIRAQVIKGCTPDIVCPTQLPYALRLIAVLGAMLGKDPVEFVNLQPLRSAIVGCAAVWWATFWTTWFLSAWFTTPFRAIILGFGFAAVVTVANAHWASAYLRRHVGGIAVAVLRQKTKRFWSEGGRRLVTFISVMSAMYVVYKVAHRVYRWIHAPEHTISMSRQGGVMSTTPSVPDLPVVTPWEVKEIEPVKVTGAAKTMTCDQALQRLQMSVARIKLFGPVLENGNRKCRDQTATAVRSGLYLVNTHLRSGWENMVLDVELLHGTEGTPGVKYKCVVHEKDWSDIPGTDFSILACAVGRHVRDSVDLFPLEAPKDPLVVKTIRRKSDGALDYDRVRATIIPVHHVESAINAPGVKYHLRDATSLGHCGLLAVAERSPPFLAGVHALGKNGEHEGAAVTLLREQVLLAISKLVSQETIFFIPEVTGVDLTSGGAVKITGHVKNSSPMRWLDGESELTYFGAHDQGSRTLRSDIEPTIAADDVCELWPDAEPIFGPPPNLNHPRAWQENLDAAAHPAVIHPEDFDLAQKDLTQHIDCVLADAWAGLAEGQTGLGVVSDEVAINGDKRVPESSCMDMKTSQGWPHNRPKKELFWRSGVATEANDDPWVAPQEFYDEVRRLEDELAQDKYHVFMFRASLKDEISKKSKQWPRLFCGAPVVFTFLMRKYFSTILQFMRRNKFGFESMCGTNAYSQDWNDLANHLLVFGDGRMIAGDFKHFDKKVPPKAMEFILSIFIHIARSSGAYTHRDLLIMRALLSSIRWCYTEVNGEIYLVGWNPSGHPFTVELNGLYNAFLMRCVFYHLMRKVHPSQREEMCDALYSELQAKDPSGRRSCCESACVDIMQGLTYSFADFVKLVTYGDDNLMSVAEALLGFDHTTVAGVLSSYGLIYTMADKSAQSVPFLHLKDVTFLKRGFKWDSSKSLYKAPLERASRYKSLLCWSKRSSLEAGEHLAVVCENLLRESYFDCDEESFNADRERVLALVERHQLLPWFPEEFVPTYAFYDAWFDLRYRGIQQHCVVGTEVEGHKLPYAKVSDFEAQADEFEVPILEVDDALPDSDESDEDLEPGESWPQEMVERLDRWIPGPRRSFPNSSHSRHNGVANFVVAMGGEVPVEYLDRIMQSSRIREAYIFTNYARQPRAMVLRMNVTTHPGDLFNFLNRELPQFRAFGRIYTMTRSSNAVNTFNELVTMAFDMGRWQFGYMYRSDGRSLAFRVRDFSTRGMESAARDLASLRAEAVFHNSGPSTN